MAMTDAAVTAWAAFGGAVVAAVPNILFQLRGFQKSDEIKAATNGHLSKVTEALALSQKEIEGLKKLVAQMAESKAVADRLAEKKKD